MELIVKEFSHLSACELYEILKARAEIFIIEQGIHYQDLDDIDYRSAHCFLWENDTVLGYFRAFYTDDTKKTVKIGRVLTREHGKGHGRTLMEKGMAALASVLPYERILIHAQTHAEGFYQKLGFVTTSAVFEEAGIPHVTMEL